MVQGLDGEVLAPEEVGGIYLPLGTEDQKCTKDFLALAYRGSHFVALVTEVKKSADSNGLSARKIECMPIAGQDGINFDVRFHIAGHDGPVQECLRMHLNLSTQWLSDGTSCLCAERPEVLADDASQDDDASQFITQGLPTELCCNHEVSAESAAMSSALLTEQPETLAKPAVTNSEIVTSSIIQDEFEQVGTGVTAWKMEGGEGEIDPGSDYVLTPPLAKEPEEMSPVVIEGLRNRESVAGEQERAAGAAPLAEQEHLCVQEHNVVAYQGVEAAKTPNDKESCVDAAKDYISAVAVAPPSKKAGPRSTRVREKRVRSAPVESDSRNLGNGDAPSDSGLSVCRPARKLWAIHLAEPVLIILAQAIFSGRPCPNATLDSRLSIHHSIKEGKAERRESKKTTVQTKAVVAEHVLGSGNPVEPKVARTELKREKRRASKAESQRLKKDNARPRWVGGSWGTALAAERKLAIYDAFYRQKRAVETRNTARKHGKCFKAATSSANTSRSTNAVAWNWAPGLALVLVTATMLFATMSPVHAPLFTGLMISQQAFVSRPTPIQTASRGPRGSNSSVKA